MRGLLPALALVWFVPACAAPPAVPEHPTWADVAPILRASCTGCHGGSAAESGSARGVIYRLDFYDMTAASCGDAANADPAARFAAAASPQIAYDLTSDDPSVRPRMPPLPSPWLPDWQWQTLLRWTRDPIKGPPPAGNHPPTIVITSKARVVKKLFTLDLLLSDPDGESVVGTLTIGDVTLRLDRPGAFSVTIDATDWGAGQLVQAQAVVCDGWTRAAYDLGAFRISG